MSKKTQDNIIHQKITETLELNYMPYAMSVIVSRAIPEIDGFKPSHRKLLYTMYKMGLIKGNKVKSADVVGQTMRLNPHGDSAIYETLVRLTRGNSALLHAFIDSKGNFGKQYSRDMAYAASRYTEVKLDVFCNEIFKNIDKDTVDFVENYNGSTTEPLLLPTTFPNILVTPNQGIAVGMASTICSFNFTEVIKTTINYIKNPQTDLMKTLIAPDFSTGGQLVYDKESLTKIYETGRGSFKVRAKYNFDSKNNCIEIYEIPYTTTIEVIIDKVIALLKIGKIKDITDIRDETGLEGLKLAIDVKKNTNIEVLMHQLYSMTTLSDSFNCNFNILVNAQPKTMGIREILESWLDFRISCVRRQTKHDINKKTEKLELLEGLSKILLDIDKAIKIIRDTDEDKYVIDNLMKAFKITQTQADYIAEIKLRNLNKQYLLNRINERDSLIDELKNLTELYNSEDKVKEFIIIELKELVKKYGKPRMTEIIYDIDIPEFTEDELIKDYGVNLFLSKEGYFKKITHASLRSASEQNFKENDYLLDEIEATNKSEILFFSNKCNVYKLKTHELVEIKASVMGDYLPNILNLEPDETIIKMINTIKYDETLIIAYENGKISKVPLSSYQTKTNRKKLTNAYGNKSDVVNIIKIIDDVDIVCVRDVDKVLLLNTSLIPDKSTKNSIGVQILTLKKGAKLTKCILKEDYISDDVEYYRTSKIPSAGHFII